VHTPYLPVRERKREGEREKRERERRERERERAREWGMLRVRECFMLARVHTHPLHWSERERVIFLKE
jgi:hypothetical protein